MFVHFIETVQNHATNQSEQQSPTVLTDRTTEIVNTECLILSRPPRRRISRLIDVYLGHV